ncbi:MAG: hypothetical protein ACRC37_00785, partial [Lentisphaeria bacterium]
MPKAGFNFYNKKFSGKSNFFRENNRTFRVLTQKPRLFHNGQWTMDNGQWTMDNGQCGKIKTQKKLRIKKIRK